MFWWRRPDGDLVKDLPLNRRVMPYLMRGRNESAFYFDYELSLRKTDAFVRDVQRSAPGDPDRRLPPRRVGAAREHGPAPDVEPVRRRRPALPAPRDLVLVRGEAQAPGGRADRRREAHASRPTSPSRTWSPRCRPRLHEDRFGGPKYVDQRARPAHEVPRVRPPDRHDGRRRRRPPRAAPRVLHRRRPDVRVRVLRPTWPASACPPGYHHLYEYGTCGVFCALGRPTAEPGSPDERARPAAAPCGSAGPSTSAPRTASRPGARSSCFKRRRRGPGGAGLSANGHGEGRPTEPRAGREPLDRGSLDRGELDREPLGREHLGGAALP